MAAMIRRWQRPASIADAVTRGPGEARSDFDDLLERFTPARPTSEHQVARPTTIAEALVPDVQLPAAKREVGRKVVPGKRFTYAAKRWGE